MLSASNTIRMPPKKRMPIGQMMARLLYGCGLRLMECLRLRLKDIDFEQSQVVVREGKD